MFQQPEVFDGIKDFRIKGADFKGEIVTAYIYVVLEFPPSSFNADVCYFFSWNPTLLAAFEAISQVIKIIAKNMFEMPTFVGNCACICAFKSNSCFGWRPISY